VSGLIIARSGALQGALAAMPRFAYLGTMEPVAPSAFETLIWVGTAVSLAGLAGLLFVIFRVSRAKRSGLGDDAMREVIRKAIPLNLGALFLSVIGLMLVIVGVFLA